MCFARIVPHLNDGDSPWPLLAKTYIHNEIWTQIFTNSKDEASSKKCLYFEKLYLLKCALPNDSQTKWNNRIEIFFTQNNNCYYMLWSMYECRKLDFLETLIDLQDDSNV